MSLVEAVTNVVVGFGVALLTQVIIFPLFGLNVSLGENFAIGGLFTLASIARSYALRRVFETIRVHTVKAQTAGPSPHDDELICTQGRVLEGQGRRIIMGQLRNTGTAVPQGHLVSQARLPQIGDGQASQLRIDLEKVR